MYKGKELEEIYDHLIRTRRVGASVKTCAYHVGIGHATLKRWLRAGTKKQGKHYKFRTRWDKASADLIVEVLIDARKACKTVDDYIKLLKVFEPEYFNTEQVIKGQMNVTQNEKPSAKEISSNIIKAIHKVNKEVKCGSSQ